MLVASSRGNPARPGFTRLAGHVAAGVAIVALSSAVAAAQSNGPLVGVLPNVILKDVVLPPAGSPGNPHVAHFTPLDPRYGTDLTGANATVASFNQFFRQQFSTLPLGSSSGGFTYTYDATLGTFVRRSPSFGPSFSERATTIGEGRFSVGANWQHASYDTLEGEHLDDGTIKFYVPHNDCCPGQNPATGQGVGDGTTLNPAFEGDLVETALTLHAQTDTVGLFAQYGVTNRWDVGVAVPIVRAQIDATVVGTIIRLSTANFPLIHTFVEGQDVTQKTVTRTASASGIGDIVLRTKYAVTGSPRGGIAAAVDLRLPTGDEANLLGAGAAQAKFFVIASGGTGKFAQHANFGYTVSGSNETSGATPLDEINYSGGVEIVANPRFTILADVIGRTLRNSGRLEVQTKTFPYQVQGTTPVQPAPTRQYSEFQLNPGHLNLLLGTAGFKLNVANNLLVSANVLFPLNDNGLRDAFTTVIGIDYGF